MNKIPLWHIPHFHYIPSIDVLQDSLYFQAIVNRAAMNMEA